MSEKLLQRKSLMEQELASIAMQISEICKSIPVSDQAQCKRLRRLKLERNDLSIQLAKLNRQIRLKEAIEATNSGTAYYRKRYCPEKNRA